MHDKRTSRKRAGILLLSCRLKIEKLVTFRVLENDFLRLFIGALLHVIALSTHAVGSMEKRKDAKEKDGEVDLPPPLPPHRKGGSLSRREKRRYFHVTIQLRKCNLHVRRCCTFSLYVITVWCAPSRSMIETPTDPTLSKHFNLLPVTTLTRSVTILKLSCSKLLAMYVCVCVYLRVYALLYYILYNIRGKLHQNMSIVNRHPLFLSD